MPDDMHGFFRSRSKARLKQRIYDCSPYLDYDLFIYNDFKNQIDEYIRGIKSCVSHLKKFGLTATQVEEFSSIIEKISN